MTPLSPAPLETLAQTWRKQADDNRIDAMGCDEGDERDRGLIAAEILEACADELEAALARVEQETKTVALVGQCQACGGVGAFPGGTPPNLPSKVSAEYPNKAGGVANQPALLSHPSTAITQRGGTPQEARLDRNDLEQELNRVLNALALELPAEVHADVCIRIKRLFLQQQRRLRSPGAGEARPHVADMIEAFAESHWKRDISGTLAFLNWKQLAESLRAGLVPGQEQT